MKKIKINFVGFWKSFVPGESLTVKLLKKHFLVEISNEPDYVFYTGYLDTNPFKYGNAIKIYFTGENIVPDFNICDYAISFEYLSYGDRAFRLPLYMLYEDDLLKCSKKHLNNDELQNNKTDFCSFVYSNKNANPIRDEIFYKISEYKKVNSGGRWLNNINQSTGIEDKNLFQSNHKFSIACENSSHDGYCTEKIVQAFASKTIPIYWGDPTIKEVFNEKAFVNVNDYANLDDLLKRIMEIDENDELYKKMIDEPAFVNRNYIDDTLEQYEKFLVNIFAQDKKYAIRRNMYFHGEMYQRYSEINAKILMLLSKIKGFFGSIYNKVHMK